MLSLVDEVVDLGDYVVSVAGNKSIVEGSCTPDQLDFIVEQVRECLVGRQVLETGFNFGMSALAMLWARPDIHVVSFDIGQWECTKVGKEYIDRRFPGRHHLVTGSSLDTLVPWLNGLHFDFALVDGGHSYREAMFDITAMHGHVRKIMVDDTNAPDVYSAYTDACRLGLITHISTHTDEYGPLVREWKLARGNF